MFEGYQTERRFKASSRSLSSFEVPKGSYNRYMLRGLTGLVAFDSAPSDGSKRQAYKKTGLVRYFPRQI